MGSDLKRSCRFLSANHKTAENLKGFLLQPVEKVQHKLGFFAFLV